MRFSPVTSVSGWRILGVNFDARCHRPRKNGERYETVEGDERRFSGCRLQIPRSSRRNLHLEGLWQPTPARPTTFVLFLSRPTVSFIAILWLCHFSQRFVSSYFSFVALLFSSFFFCFVLFWSAPPFLSPFPLAVYIQRYFSAPAHPFWYAENVE